MSGGQTPRQVQLIQDFQPTVIMCTPSYALNIADEFDRQGLDPFACSLEIGNFGAEPWTDSMRREIEARLGLEALDLYGLSEVIGPGVASECIETKDGVTVWEDHFYPEIIKPETGEPLPDGELGELVFTIADERGTADHPVPNPGPERLAARHGAADASHGPNYRAYGRHDDYPRRERVPKSD